MRPRDIPSVDAVLSSEAAAPLSERYPRALLTEAVRHALEDLRREALACSRDQADSSTEAAAARDAAGTAGAAIAANDAATPAAILKDAARWLAVASSARPVAAVNATGVVLHTNLGRAPLAASAIAALVEAARAPSALELDLESGARGERDDLIAAPLCALTGAESALAVNNNAAAVLLAVQTFAGGREVIVSRGELIEIGGSFRLPEILAVGGAALREVGTTNRTRVADYAAAIGPRTGLILRTHPSNYRIVGFTEKPALGELVELARQARVPLVEDLGSGALIDLEPFGLAHEPTPGESIRAGVDVVTFSGDKLLGGPQAGLAVGAREPIERMRRHPMKRALRLDKVILAALAATLDLYRFSRDVSADIPVLRLLSRRIAELEALARDAASALRTALPADVDVEVVESEAEVGSGAQPTLALPSRAVALSWSGGSPLELAAAFRRARPAIVGRVAQDRLLLDVRGVERAQDLVPQWPAGAGLSEVVRAS